MKIDLELNAIGLRCPLPLLRLKKTLNEMTVGQVVKVSTTDPAAHLDFGVYLEQSGHLLLITEKMTDKQIFYIQKQ
jgi:tRNA 2-thiouridine synthesizing protein A